MSFIRGVGINALIVSAIKLFHVLPSEKGRILVAGLLSVSMTTPLYAQAPSANAVSVRSDEENARWREDLRFFATELPKLHVDAYNYVSAAAFAAAVAELDGVIPRLTERQIRWRLMLTCRGSRSVPEWQDSTDEDRKRCFDERDALISAFGS